MMDVAAGSRLPDPWSAAGAQAAYPWRGRITCDPAPTRDGTPDKTSAAATQVAAFFGSASVGGQRMVATAAWCCITQISARKPAASTPS